MMDQLDAVVALGVEKSLAAVVERALIRELRRIRLVEEVQILATSSNVRNDL